jgi:prepilin-type N-terminal cleavage/methylation domain-containing protein
MARTHTVRTPAPAASSQPSRGFTIVELLVVIAIITLIVALLIPAIGKVRSQSRTTQCLTNQRSIGQADYSYATNNAGRWASPSTDSGIQVYQNAATQSPSPPLYATKHAWVWANPNNATYTSGNSSFGYEKPKALEDGSLFSYIGSPGIYVSPQEPTNPFGSVAPDNNRRIRSYSLNAWVGTRSPDDLQEWASFPTSLGIPVSSCNTTTVARVPQPSRTMLCIVEDDSLSWNNLGWLIDPLIPRWIDTPAYWSPGAVTMAYCDGSFEIYDLKRLDLPAMWDPSMGGTPHRWIQPADSVGFAIDWKWFRDRQLPGVIPNSTYGFASGL